MTNKRFLGLLAASLVLCLGLSGGAWSQDGDGADSLAAYGDRIGVLDTPWQQALEEAINPEDYDCDADTDFRVWIDETIAAIEAADPGTMNALGGVGAFNWAAYYSLLFDNDDSDDYIGVSGEYTREQRKRHKDNQRFWDVDTDDVLLLGMHGSVVADDAKMIPTVRWFFLLNVGVLLPDPVIQSMVDGAQETIEETIGYDHPILTLNAFAFSLQGDELPGLGAIPDKIVMGDGIIEALEDIGLGDNAPDYVHAHEFAHHVQYELDVLPPEQTPETTRHAELMADGLSAYYMAHARGATFQTKRIVDAVSAAYGVGDCSFTSPGHHGTPNQREAAAEWGAGIANSAKKQGHIKSAWTMYLLFEDVFDELIAPDAP